MHSYVPYSGFEIHRHLRVRDVPAPGGDAEVNAALQEAVSAPMDLAHPLWEGWLLRNESRQQSTILIKVQHCITDGIASNLLILTLADTHDGAHLPELPRQMSGVRPAKRSAAHRALQVFPAMLLAIVSLLRYAEMMLRLALLDTDFKKRLTGRGFVDAASDSAGKTLSISAPVSLAAIKRARHTHGVSVNDVVLGLLAGALRRAVPAGLAPRGTVLLVPVSVRRSLELHHDLDVQASAVVVTLPLEPEPFAGRVQEVARTMRRCKQDIIQPYVNLATMTLCGFLPSTWTRNLFNYFFSKGTAVVTNVPGPQQRFAVASLTVTNCLALGIQPSAGGLSVTLVSYAGQMVMTVMADDTNPRADLPRVLTDLFVDEFNKHCAEEPAEGERESTVVA